VTRTILNAGAGAWVFEEHAYDLAQALWVDASDRPADLNFIQAWSDQTPPSGDSFVPWASIVQASDKRLQAEAFTRDGVPTPETQIISSEEELRTFLRDRSKQKWVLKFPTGCGAKGHQFVTAGTELRDDWPLPFVIQEFIQMEEPAVYRLYCVAGKIFGWNARRFPSGTKTSPWVAHAQGARYIHLGNPPEEASRIAEKAFKATGLLDSFGAADLLPSQRGWLALEVGTDGLYNHVDRDFASPSLKDQLDRCLAEAFWKDSVTKPWGSGPWFRRRNSE